MRRCHDLLTVGEVAARLQVHPRTVLRYLRDKKLGGFRLPHARAHYGEWRIPEVDLVAFVDSLIP